MVVEFFPAAAEIVRVGQWSLRWYGVFYVVAFGVVYWWGRKLLRWREIDLSDDDWLLVVTVGIAGALLGGRLGYVVLYEPGYFLAQPAEIFQLWTGGMSFHGGLVGVGVALWWVARRLKIHWLALTDVMVGPVALGLALGRVGNWLNGELFVGNMALVASGALVGVGLAALAVLRNSGRVAAPTLVFLLGYSVQRLVLEMWRIDGWESFGGLTRGQWLTVPVLIVGLCLLARVASVKS